ncbi:hypothetical protein Ciccas_003253 [Cichlidogyrus casuarinus]|uniref:Uncharacterized protein n=1 Tax=Cichlidogyrus casuarinus TaxID=1844966 RepID=A0ABD2QI52_9PLAT
MQSLDAKFDFPEPEKSLNMDSLIAYLEKHSNVIKSPFQVALKSTEDYSLYIKDHKFSLERYIDVDTVDFPFSAKQLLLDEKTSILESLKQNVNLLSASLVSYEEENTKSYSDLLGKVTELLEEACKNSIQRSPKSVLELRIPHDNNDLASLFFEIISNLFVGETVCIICYSPHLCLALHILHSIITAHVKDKFLVVFDKFSCKYVLRDRLSISIVYSDADLNNAAHYVFDSFCYSQGLSSFRPGLVLVQQNILDGFKTEVSALFQNLKDQLPKLCPGEEKLLSSQGAKQLVQNAAFYECPASIIDQMNFENKPRFCLLVPFRTMKESLCMVRAFNDKQVLHSDALRSLKYDLASLCLFGINSNALWQITTTVHEFPCIFINPDFRPAFASALLYRFERSISLKPLYNHNSAEIDKTIMDIVSKLKQEQNKWSEICLADRLKRLRNCLPNTEIDSTLLLEDRTQKQVIKIISKLDLMLSVGQYRNQLGIVFLANCNEQNLVHCLAAGNTALVPPSFKIPQGLESLVLHTNEDASKLQKAGVYVAKVDSEKCTIRDFLSVVDVAASLGKEMFAN